MRTLRWIIPTAAIALFSLWGCNGNGYEEGSDTIVIEDRTPDLIIEQDDDPEGEIRIED